MKEPQIIWIALSAINLFFCACLNGTERSGKYNFAVSLCSVAFTAWLLWWGGFFG